MTPSVEIRKRVLAWRTNGLPVRLAQTFVVGPFAWFSTSSILAPEWFMATLSVILAEAVLLRLTRRIPQAHYDRLALVCASLSTGVFSLAALILLTRPSPVSLAAAAMLLSATAISGVIMARGWLMATLATAGAPILMLVLCGPAAAFLLHQPLSDFDLIVFEVAAIAVLAFTTMLGVTLSRETDGKLRERRRWRMVFDESPLPQARFDASALFGVLHPATRPAAMGEDLRARLTDMDQVMEKISFIAVNNAFLRMLGAPPSSLDTITTRFDAAFMQSLAASLNAMSADGSIPAIEGGVIRDNGDVVDVCAHIHTLPDEASPWAECVASFVDVTEIKATARFKDEAVAAAEAANRAKSEFLAITSHEIRTPLNGVLGMVQAMERTVLTFEQRSQLAVIRNSGDTLLKILNTTLDLSRIEAGDIRIDPSEFDLQALLSEVAAGFAPQAEAKGVALTVTASPEAHGVYFGDPVRLRQIIYNLVANALKFTAEGSIRIEADRTTDGLVFTVADTGIGIAPEQIERLFERFVQADASATRQHGGVGLGLAVCRELSRAMGGDIVGASSIGQGARFTVTLPLPRIGDVSKVARAEPRPTEMRSSRPMRILAAEDHPVNQLVLKTLLAAGDLEAVFVENGQEALDAWMAESWDLILMDVQMPVMDGVSAVRAIRVAEALDGRRATPVIALTANAMPQQIEAYMAAGMTGFVAKPINLHDLFQAMEACAPELSLAEVQPEQQLS